MTPRHLFAALCLAPGLALLLAAPARADEATDAIRQADALYRQGQIGKAYGKLEDAAAAIMRVLSDRYARTFAAAPPGWTARPVETSATSKVRLGRGIQLSRLYFQDGGTGVARAQVLADDTFVMAQLIETLRKREAGRAGGPVPFPIDGVGTAYLTYKPRFRDAHVGVLVGRRFYITVHVNRMEGADAVARRILTTWDFGALKKAGGLD